MLLDKIKADLLEARKNKWQGKVNLLTTLVSEATMIGKNDGNRETTDAETVQVIQKFIKNTLETMFALEHTGRWDESDAAEIELRILERYLPQQMTDHELAGAIMEIIVDLEDNSKKKNH